MADYEYISFTKEICKVGVLDGDEFPTDTPIEDGDTVSLRLADKFLDDASAATFVDIVAVSVLHNDGGTRIKYDRAADGQDYRPEDFAAVATKHNKSCALTDTLCDDLPTYTGGHTAHIAIQLTDVGDILETIDVAHVTNQAATEAAILAAVKAAVPNAYISEGTPNQLCMRLGSGGTLGITSGA